MKRQKTQLFYSILINHCMAFCISLSSINRSPIFTGTPFHIFVAYNQLQSLSRECKLTFEWISTLASTSGDGTLKQVSTTLQIVEPNVLHLTWIILLKSNRHFEEGRRNFSLRTIYFNVIITHESQEIPLSNS